MTSGEASQQGSSTMAVPQAVAWLVWLLALTTSPCSADIASCSAWRQQVGERDNRVRAVNNGEDLTDASLTPSLMMTKLSLINGTHWLNLGGSVEHFTLVVGVPPATSSDVTLGLSLDELKQANWSPRGVIFDFHPPSLYPTSDVVLQKYDQDMNIWLTQDHTDVDYSFFKQHNVNPNVKMIKKYGLDTVFDRVKNEAVLLERDFQKTLMLIKDIFSYEDGRITGNDRLYVQRKYQTIQRQNLRNSFTDLYMNNLVRLIESIDDLRKKDQVDFLPDLQARDVSYTESDIQKIRQILKKFSDTCVLLSLRAGILAKDESVKNIKSLLAEFPNTMVLVWSEPYDFVNIKNFSSALKVLGDDRILLDIPEHLNLQIKSFDATGVVTSVVDSRSDSAAGRTEGTLWLHLFVTVMITTLHK